MSKLPPLHSLPSWSRSSLERRTVQRTIAKDRVPPLKVVGNASPVDREGKRSPAVVQFTSGRDSVRTVSAASAASSPSRNEKASSNTRVAQLESSITFLQQQHEDTLSKLHKEIEKLKSDNKELNFKLTLAKENSPLSETLPRSGSYYRSKIRRSESEMKNLKLMLVEAQKQNVDLSRRLQERDLSGRKYRSLPPVASMKQPTLKGRNKTVDTSARSTDGFSSPETVEIKTDRAIEHLNLFSPGKTTVLQVTLGKKGEIFVQPSTGSGPRSPTTSEYKDIIHHLEDTNKRQGQELCRLKDELREGNRPTKWSPETYLMAKTLTGSSHYDQNRVMLPALPEGGSANVGGRRQGQQTVARGRGKRDVNY